MNCICVYYHFIVWKPVVSSLALLYSHNNILTHHFHLPFPQLLQANFSTSFILWITHFCYILLIFILPIFNSDWRSLYTCLFSEFLHLLPDCYPVRLQYNAILHIKYLQLCLCILSYTASHKFVHFYWLNITHNIAFLFLTWFLFFFFLVRIMTQLLF